MDAHESAYGTGGDFTVQAKIGGYVVVCGDGERLQEHVVLSRGEIVRRLDAWLEVQESNDCLQIEKAMKGR